MKGETSRDELNRRRFLAGFSALGAGALMPCHWNPAAAAAMSETERNKAIALRFKKAQGEEGGEAVIRGLLAPTYTRTRAGLEHLGANAQGQDHPSPGRYLRTAIPDRVDVIQEVIAEGDTVGLLFRVTGTHRGNLYGIPATNRKSISTKPPSCGSPTAKSPKAGSWQMRQGSSNSSVQSFRRARTAR